MNKKIFLCFFILLSILIIFENADAVWISPPRLIYDFEPNLEIKESVCIRLHKQGTLNATSGRLNVTVLGRLAQYVILDKTNLIEDDRGIFLSFEGDEKKCIKYDVLLPSTLTPGTNSATISVREIIESTAGGTGMRALAGNGQQIWINVPYPGKYLKASLSAHDVEAEKPVEFTVTIESKGNETISKVSADIEIINQNNVSLGSLPTTEITNLESMASETLKAIWAPSARDVGTYRAYATVYYDGKTAEAEISFRIGELTLKLINISSPPIKINEIGKIDVLVESIWISTIKDAYVEVKGAGKTAKSLTTYVEPWKRTLIPVYFPTEGLEAGEYPATATVYYADKTEQKEFTITVFEDKNMYYFMAGVSIVLAIIIALIVIFFIKKRDYKRKMHHAMYWQQ